MSTKKILKYLTENDISFVICFNPHYLIDRHIRRYIDTKEDYIVFFSEIDKHWCIDNNIIWQLRIKREPEKEPKLYMASSFKKVLQCYMRECNE